MDTSEETKQEASKKITFRFCRECSNLLYPKEDQYNDTLMFACRSCQYTETATSDCVYRNSLQDQIAETAGNIEDVAQDPTVGDASASQSIVDSFMNDSYYEGGGDEEDDGLIPETCTYCGKEILCPHCGAPSSEGLALEVPDVDDDTSPGGEEALIDAERRERALSSATHRQT